MTSKPPLPPKSILDYSQGDDDETSFIEFAPASDLREFVTETILNENHELYNPAFEHITLLNEPEFLQFLWASDGFNKAEKRVLGQCERVSFMAGGWKKARQEKQMRDWFGFTPTYLITLDAYYCAQCTTDEYLALIEHELAHIGVKRDEDGNMLFSDVTGLPKHYLANHDIEEFYSVIERYKDNADIKAMKDKVANGG